jgi:hypothetical protein
MKIRQILVISFLVVFSGCAPKKVVIPLEVPATPTKPNVTPFGLLVEPKNGGMELKWKQNGTGNISGYNIYILQSPVLGSEKPAVKPYNNEPYPGDTNPDDEWITYNAQGLTNGVKYFVSVRVIYPDYSLSKSSNEITTICGPRSEFSLSVRYQSDKDGYSLMKDHYVKADSDENDLYFYSKDGVDYLASPTRLNGYLRESKFVQVNAEDSFDKEGNKLPPVVKGSFEDKISVKPGDRVLLKTVEGYSALLTVVAVSGHDKSREISIRSALCPAKGGMIF